MARKTKAPPNRKLVPSKTKLDRLLKQINAVTCGYLVLPMEEVFEALIERRDPRAIRMLQAFGVPDNMERLQATLQTSHTVLRFGQRRYKAKQVMIQYTRSNTLTATRTWKHFGQRLAEYADWRLNETQQNEILSM